ncbi:hypothetical protein EBU94_00765 [bacterium]|jgi:hypothetical protein|nr:hypothetical protein [bacterium]
MIINRVKHLIKYIEFSYPQMQRKKFDVSKSGARIYLFAINAEGNLTRTLIYRGCLSMTNEVPQLRNALDKNIKEAVKKLGLR